MTDPAVAARAFRLDRNFRSTPRLIDAVNALFMDGPGDYTFGDESIDYRDPLKYDESKPALTLPDGTDDPSPFRIVEVENKSSRNQAVVDTVLNILEDQRAKGLTPKDIAILVTSHTDGADYRDMLKDVGVPAVLQKAGSVTAFL